MMTASDSLPNDNPSAAGTAVSPKVVKPSVPAQEDVQLPTSDTLSEDAANALAAENRTSVVAIFGPVGSGKSTLIGSIHERFLKGGFPGIRFAGSRTLMGFEELCHLGRVAAGLSEADTERTRLSSGFMFYHVQLAARNSRSNVLFTDVSGEATDAAIASDEGCRQLRYLPRADHVAFLLDGQRIGNVLERHYAESQLVDLAKAMANVDMVRPSARVYLVLSKNDLIQKQAEPARLYAIADACLNKLIRIFPSQTSQSVVYRVAARAVNNGHSPADGLKDLLHEWMHTRAIEAPQSDLSVVRSSHAIDHYRRVSLPADQGYKHG